MSSCAAHVVVASWSAPGHLNPIIQLASYLVANRAWKPETFVTLLAMVNENTQGKVSLPLHPKIRVVTLTTIPMRTWVRDMFGSSEELVKECVDRTALPHKDWPKPSAVIYDMVTPFGYILAEKLGIPGFAFLPSPLFCLWLIWRLSVTSEAMPGESDGIMIPGIGKFHIDVPFSSSDDKNPMQVWHHSMMKSAQIGIEKSRAVLANDVNSFYSAEFLSSVRQIVGKSVLCCGPLALMDPRSQLRGAEATSDVFRFMNRCAPRSVLFISFGTSWTVSNADLVELAHGVALSQKFFVFSHRGQNKSADPFPEYAPPNPPASECTDDSGLPSTFRDDTRDRGLVVTWVNQPLLLRHQSLGCFMTHCGWNSILEGMSFGGVPFLLLPIGGDQKPNAIFLEKHLKCGRRISNHVPSQLDRHEICRLINLVFEDEEMKSRSLSLRETILQETSDSGMSETNLRKVYDEFSLSA